MNLFHCLCLAVTCISTVTAYGKHSKGLPQQSNRFVEPLPWVVDTMPRDFRQQMVQPFLYPEMRQVIPFHHQHSNALSYGGYGRKPLPAFRPMFNPVQHFKMPIWNTWMGSHDYDTFGDYGNQGSLGQGHIPWFPVPLPAGPGVSGVIKKTNFMNKEFRKRLPSNTFKPVFPSNRDVLFMNNPRAVFDNRITK